MAEGFPHAVVGRRPSVISTAIASIYDLNTSIKPSVVEDDFYGAIRVTWSYCKQISPVRSIGSCFIKEMSALILFYAEIFIVKLVFLEKNTKNRTYNILERRKF